MSGEESGVPQDLLGKTLESLTNADLSHTVCVCVSALLKLVFVLIHSGKVFRKRDFHFLYYYKGMLAVGGASSDSAHT